MKKIIYSIMIICIILGGYSNVVAQPPANEEQTCEVDTLGGGGIEMGINFQVKDVWSRVTSYFYTASIGGKTAFCVNPGKKRGTTYAFWKKLTDTDYTEYQQQMMAKSYNYFEKHKNAADSLTHRKVAQLMIWLSTITRSYAGNTDIITRYEYEVEQGYVYSNEMCYKKEKNTRSGADEFKTVNCSEMPAIVAITQAFSAMNIISSMGSDTGITCMADKVRTYKGWEYFDCDTYNNVLTAKANGNNLIKSYYNKYGFPWGNDSTYKNGVKYSDLDPSKCSGYPGNRSALDSTQADFCAYYNTHTGLNGSSVSDVLTGTSRFSAFAHMIMELSNMSSQQYVDMINLAAGGGNQQGSGNAGLDYAYQFLNSQTKAMLSELNSTSPGNLGDFEIWCADTDMDGVADNYGSYQCFLVKKVTNCTSCSKDLKNALDACEARGLSVAQCISSGGVDEVANKYGYPEKNKDIKNPDNPRCYQGGPNGEPKTCDELLENNYYKMYTYKCSDIIGDAPLQCEDGSDGRISKLVCKEKCDPYVNPDYARCDNKGNADDHVIYLSDAYLSKQSPDKQACIFNNVAYNINNDKVSSKFADIGYNGHVYCSIYCWEDLELKLPSEPQPYGYYSPIAAGRMFQWGVENSGNIFAKMEVHKTCWIKQKSADYGLFEKNWNDNDDAIKQRYADYLAEVEYNKQGADKIDEGGECCKGGAGNETKLVASLSPSGATTAAAYGYDSCSCGGLLPAGYYECSCTSETCSGGWGKKYSLPSVDYTLPGTNIKGTSNSKDVCASSKSEVNIDELHDSSEESSRYNAVQDALNERVKIYNAIMRCQSTSSLNTSTMYDNQTKLTIQDNNDLKLNTRGVSNFTLEKVATYANVETPAVDLGYRSGTALRCYQVPTANGFSYSTGDPCASGDNSYTITTYSRQHANGQNNEYVWKYTGNWNFIYPKDFYFVAKMSDDYVNSITKELPNVSRENYSDDLARIRNLQNIVENEKNIYYVEHGQAGIPTFIDTETGKFYIDIKIENLGSMKDGVSHFAKVVENKDLYEWIDLDTYTCPYQVENIIFESDEGGGPCKNRYCFAIVYRIIDMGAGNKSRIFPGKDGNDGTTHRKIGTNWASFADTEKFTRITTTAKVYGGTPLYSIELSPTLIGEIRKDNNKYRDSNKDPYTSYEYPNNEKKIRCNLTDSVENTTCVSGYITELIKKRKITGRFAIDNETLRIKKILEYKNA